MPEYRCPCGNIFPVASSKRPFEKCPSCGEFAPVVPPEAIGDSWRSLHAFGCLGMVVLTLAVIALIVLLGVVPSDKTELQTQLFFSRVDVCLLVLILAAQLLTAVILVITSLTRQTTKK